MTYQDVSNLTADVAFNARLSAALTQESLGKTDELSNQLLENQPYWGASIFGPAVAASPGLGDKYATGGSEAVEDGDILSAVQANWERIAALHPADEELPVR